MTDADRSTYAKADDRLRLNSPFMVRTGRAVCEVGDAPKYDADKLQANDTPHVGSASGPQARKEGCVISTFR